VFWCFPYAFWRGYLSGIVTEAYFGSLVCFFMVNMNARLEINNFWEEQERNKQETISGSVKKKIGKFQKIKIYK
jgi:hypothetical protein